MEFISDAWVLIALLGIIVSFKIILPKESYELRTSLIVAIIGALIFAFKFWIILNNGDLNFLWPLLFCIICLAFIYRGGKNVAYKTLTAVFSNITKEPIGIMNAGSLNWADPLFETVTISVDGDPGMSLDLQELRIKIKETPLMQTSTRGIQAKVKNITFMLEITGDPEKLLDIEGGAKTVRERIVEFIDEFFLKEISKKSPDDLDQNKSDTIEKLCENLKKEVDDFCHKNNYPYKIVDSVIIADTELEAKYYEVLAKNQFAKLEQEAKDTEAEKLSGRLIKAGRELLPSGSEKEQTEASLIALGIVKKDISEKKYAIDSDLAQLAKDIALYFKK